jgi:ribokinase
MRLKISSPKVSPTVTRSKIVVVGSFNTDMTVVLDRLPRAGETLIGGQFQTAAGGKGANQAVAAARAGGDVSLVARVGRDTVGNAAVTRFEKDGIDITHVVRDARLPSGVALIFVGKDGENSIAVAGGANGALSVADIRRARPAIATANVVLMQLETPLPTIMAAARLAARHRSLVILNPAPARPLPDALLRHVSILTPNESETELLTGVKLTNAAALKRAAEKLRRRGVKTVVITLGARGALLANAAGIRRIAGFKVRVVDSTAAGDVFNGALAVALTEGQPIETAIRFANAAAAISVTRRGAQSSAPTRREIVRFIKG